MRTSADLITFEFLTVILFYVTLKKYGFTKNPSCQSLLVEYSKNNSQDETPTSLLKDFYEKTPES